MNNLFLFRSLDGNVTNFLLLITSVPDLDVDHSCHYHIDHAIEYHLIYFEHYADLIKYFVPPFLNTFQLFFV